jgi:hypothetical protein
MVHARSEAEIALRERALRDDLGGFDFVSLRTAEEYKKIPYRYAPD